MRAKIFAGVLIALSSICFSGCQKNEEMLLVQNDPDGVATSSVGVHMTNSSSIGTRLDKVNVDIVLVRVRMSTGQWIDLDTKAGVYDLMALQNGIESAIAMPTSMAPGEIVEMRVVIGSHNSVVVEGHELQMPVLGGREHRVKIPGNSIVVPDGNNVRLLLDFDAQRSLIRKNEPTKFYLRPVMRIRDYSSDMGH